MQSDRDLIVQFYKGSKEAFFELVARYEKLVYSVSRLISPTYTEKVLAGVFSSISNCPDGYAKGEVFKTRLLRETLSRSYAYSYLEEVSNLGDLGGFDSAIICLESDLKSVFILKEVCGLSAEEVGSVLMLSPSVVDERLKRAREIVRDSFYDLGNEDLVQSFATS